MTLKRIRLSYLISHDEHVDDPRRPVAPVNQSVALIAQRRGEVTRTESLVADVVDTGPNQLGQHVWVDPRPRLTEEIFYTGPGMHILVAFESSLVGLASKESSSLLLPA